MNNFWEHQIVPSAGNPGTHKSNDKMVRYHQYSKYPGSAANNNRYNNHHHQQHYSTTTESNAEWGRPGSSSQTWHNIEPQPEPPDGLPYEPDKEDKELTRKRKELQVIEEQIMLKRASLALKTVNVKTYMPVLCSEKSEPIESNKPLRERVKHILQLRNRTFRTNGPSRRRSFYVQHDHPLKQRVTAALQQGFVYPLAEPQNCKPAPFQNNPSSAKEEMNKNNKGFMRFLDILNKGVDIDKLTEIVNAETVKTSQNGVQIHSTTTSFESSSVEREKLEDSQPHSDSKDQQKHLQNILESLGLSLGTDEISRLGDRTQERLYGKKQRTDEEANASEDKTQTVQQQKREQYSPGLYTRSSSSSDSSSTSSSGQSPARTPSPSRRRRSPSPIWSKRRSSWSPLSDRHSYSPKRRRDSRSPQRRRDSHSAKKRRDSHSPHPRDHSHLQNLSPKQPYPYTPSPYLNPLFPSQMHASAYSYSQYTAYYNYWGYNQAPLPESSAFCPQNYQQNPPHVFPQQQNDQDKPPSETNSSESRAELEESQHVSANNTRCLVPIQKAAVWNYRQNMSRDEKTQLNRQIKAHRKHFQKLKKQTETSNKGRETRLKDVIIEITKVKGNKAGESVAQGTSGTQESPMDATKLKKRKRKKKRRVFIERTKEMEKLLNNRPGPVTRALGLKNPEKLLKFDEKLVELEDVCIPPMCIAHKGKGP